MSLPPSKLIDHGDFGSADLRPYLAEVNGQDAARFGAPPGDIKPDARQWQHAMALRSLAAVGAGAWVAGIGAGSESTLYALARRGMRVFAVDRYLARTPWSDTASAGMLIDPARGTRDVPRGQIVPIHANAVRVNLPSEAMDAVFCCGMLEHLGSLDAVALAAREIGRILKPGGVAVIATEMRLDGPADRSGLDDAMLLFTPELLDRCIVRPSGLALREPLDLDQSDATFETRSAVADFIERAGTWQCIEEKRAAGSGLVLFHEGFLFCPVVLTLHKDRPQPPHEPTERERQALSRVDGDEAALARELEQRQRAASEASPVPESHPVFGEVERLQREVDMLRAAYDRSNAWKAWRLMRPARFVYRRFKRWRG